MKSNSNRVLMVILGLALVMPGQTGAAISCTENPRENIDPSMNVANDMAFSTLQVRVPRVRKPRRPMMIKVTAPKPGLKFKGSRYAIQWTCSPGYEQTKLSIYLQEMERNHFYLLADNVVTGNYGVYADWQVKKEYRNGSHRIVIRQANSTPGPLGEQWAGKIFTITEPYIKVLAITPPRTSYSAGQLVFVHWERLGPMNSLQVSVAAVNDQTKSRTVIEDPTYNGVGQQTRRWTIPASMTPGLYRIHVRTLDNQYEDYGPPFTIE